MVQAMIRRFKIVLLLLLLLLSEFKLFIYIQLEAFDFNQASTSIRIKLIVFKALKMPIIKLDGGR